MRGTEAQLSDGSEEQTIYAEYHASKKIGEGSIIGSIFSGAPTSRKGLQGTKLVHIPRNGAARIGRISGLMLARARLRRAEIRGGLRVEAGLEAERRQAGVVVGPLNPRVGAGNAGGGSCRSIRPRPGARAGAIRSTIYPGFNCFAQPSFGDRSRCHWLIVNLACVGRSSANRTEIGKNLRTPSRDLISRDISGWPQSRKSARYIVVTKANLAKAKDAKPRVLASSATPHATPRRTQDSRAAGYDGE